MLFIPTWNPPLFTLQAISDGVIGKILDNSIALGVMLVVGYFFFKDYQKRLIELDKRLAEQSKKHQESNDIKDAKMMDLMLSVAESVSGLTSVLKQNQDDNARRDMEHNQILRGIEGTMRTQKTIFESFMQFAKEGKYEH